MLAAAVDSVDALQVLLKNGATVELQVLAYNASVGQSLFFKTSYPPLLSVVPDVNRRFVSLSASAEVFVREIDDTDGDLEPGTKGW